MTHPRERSLRRYEVKFKELLSLQECSPVTFFYYIFYFFFKEMDIKRVIVLADIPILSEICG